MIKHFSYLKDISARILFLILIANFFYDDPTLYLYKRIIFSICIYYAIWEITKFYIIYNSVKGFSMPAFYNVYIPLILIFVLIALSMDLVNPNLKIITLLNNPYALLSVGPIFLFVVGANTDDLEPLFKVLLLSVLLFILVVLLPIFGKIKYYQGYICAYAFIPVFFFADTFKKHRILSYVLLIVGIIFSNISDYRIIALRILLFISLVIGLTICKKFGFLKLVIIVICCAGLYQFLTNLEDILYLFKDLIGVRSFDDDDTRGFLWEEVFSELKGTELIFGRGFLGTYFSEYFLMLLTRLRTYADHYDRFGVEVGFLHLILKGGFFWYLLYIIPILYSSIKGIFWHYQDKMVFYISIFLLTELLLMFIENIPYFSFQFSLIFFFAGYAIRKMKNNEDLDNNTVVQPG
jgi:hypothetical protein